MNRLRRWLETRVLDDVSRRALEETLADDAYERHGGRRRVVRLRTVAAFARIVSIALAGAWGLMFRHLTVDVRHTLRRLRAASGTTTLAIVTLAIGIGVTTAVYAAVYTVWLRPPDGPNLDRVVEIRHTPHPRAAMSWPDYRELAEMQTVFDRLGGYLRWFGSATAAGQSREVFGEVVTGEYFEALGVVPADGRLIQSADDRAGAPPVVAIGDHLWTRLFARDPAVVGRVLKLDDQAFTVVGIVPASYRGGENNASLRPTDLWVAFGAVEHLTGFTGLVDRDDRQQWRLRVRARLAAGQSFADAQMEVRRIGARLDAGAPIGAPGGRPNARENRQQWSAIPIPETGLAEWPRNRQVATTVMVALGLVMLVVCGNLVNLTLARAGSRTQDVTVRLALGAPRWRLLRESLIECSLVAGAGGGAGLLLTNWLTIWATQALPFIATDVGSRQPALEPAVIALAVASTMVALVISTIAASWSSWRVDLRKAGAGHGSAGAGPRWRGRQVLVAGQVTVSVALVLLAATAAGRAAAIAHEDLGIDLDRLAVLSARTSPQYDGERLRPLLERAASQIARRPDVETIALASGIRHIEPENAYLSLPGRAATVGAQLIASSPEIFATLGARILRGRALDAGHLRAREQVAVISELTAKELYGDVDPIGRIFQLTRQRAVGEPESITRTWTVIGVVDDRGPDERQDSGDIYVPLGIEFSRNVVVIARTSGAPEELAGPMADAMRAVDPEVAVTAVGTGLELGRPEAQGQLKMAGLTAGLGGFALALALVGLFGVLAHVVRRRVREFGVRMALGATADRISRGVVREGLRPVLVGVIAGTIFGIVTRLAARPAFLEVVPAVDLWALIAVPVPMLVAGALASYLPARRAASVDPNVALRET